MAESQVKKHTFAYHNLFDLVETKECEEAENQGKQNHPVGWQGRKKLRFE